MSFVISSKSNFSIAGFTFNCLGSYDNGQWILQATWNGEGTLSANNLLQKLFGTGFQLPTSLPVVSFTAVSATLTPGESYVFSGTSSVLWSKPLGIPVGLNIEDLGFSFKHKVTKNHQEVANAQSATNTIQAEGKFKITIAGHSQTFDVVCYFAGSSPQFILVDKIPSLSLDDVLSHFQIAIPDNFINLTFTKNQIYFLKNGANTADLPPLSFTPQAGLNFNSDVTMELAGVTFPSIEIDVNVNQTASGTKKKGISFSGTFDNSITLLKDFLVLTGDNTNYTGGPTLKVDSQKSSPSFGFDCGFQFLGKNFGTAGMTVLKDTQGNAKFTGNLRYNGTLGPFKGVNNTLSLGMSYSKDTGFEITNWPATSINKNLLTLADFASKLSAINTTGCPKAKALNLVFKRTLKTSFRVTPKFVTKKPNIDHVIDGQLYVILTGSYTIATPNIGIGKTAEEVASGENTDIVVCSVNLPTLVLSFTTPSDFSFSTILQSIEKEITNNAPALVQQLYDEPAALAKFLMVFAGREALNKAKNDICNEPKGKDKDEPSDQDELEDFLNDAGKGGELTGSTLGAIGSAAIGIFSIAASGIGVSCGSSSSGNHHHQHQNHHSPPNVKPLPAPTFNNTVEYLDIVKTWTVGWNAIANANYYEVRLYDNASSTKIVHSKFIRKTEASFKGINPSKAPYKCKVFAWANPGLNYNSPTTSILLNQLDPVSNIISSCDIDKNEINFSFDGVKNAEQYTVALINPENMHTIDTQKLSQTSGNFPVNNGVSVLNAYQISVVATASNYIPSNIYTSSSQPLEFGIGHMTIGSTFIIS